MTTAADPARPHARRMPRIDRLPSTPAGTRRAGVPSRPGTGPARRRRDGPSRCATRSELSCAPETPGPPAPSGRPGRPRPAKRRGPHVGASSVARGAVGPSASPKETGASRVTRPSARGVSAVGRSPPSSTFPVKHAVGRASRRHRRRGASPRVDRLRRRSLMRRGMRRAARRRSPSARASARRSLRRRPHGRLRRGAFGGGGVVRRTRDPPSPVLYNDVHPAMMHRGKSHVRRKATQ